MTNLSIADIDNFEHELTPEAKKVVMYGKTAGGAFVPVLVNADGSLPISGDVENFLDLTDTPSAYAGNTLDIVRVNAGETALEFVDPSVIGATINFNDLGDVDTTGVAAADFVQFDGANWVDFDLFNTANVWTADQRYNDDVALIFGTDSDIRITWESVSSRLELRPLIGQNIKVLFQGDSNSGLITWDNINNHFQISEHVLITTQEELRFGSDVSFPQGKWVLVFDSTDLVLTNALGTGEFKIKGDVDLLSQVGSGSLLWTEATGRLLYTLSDDSSSDGFKILKTESIKPSGSPEYFDLELTRTWDSTGSLVNLMNIAVTDNHDISAGGPPHLTNIFRMAYTRASSASSILNLPTAFKISMNDSGTYTGTGRMNAAFLDMSGNLTGASNTSSNITTELIGFTFSSRVETSNAGTGTAIGNTTIINWNSQFTQISTDTINATGFILKPNIFQVGAGPTYNFVGIDAIPTFQFDQGGTLTSIGFRYNPSGAVVGNATHTAFISTRGEWKNQADNAKHFWGALDDVSIQFTSGNVFEITFEQTTTEMVINQGAADTNLRIESDTNINMFFLDAGLNRIGIGVNNPAVTLDVDGDIWVRNQGDVRWGDADNSNFVAFQGAATISANVTWTLPSADGTANQVLTTSGGAILSWTTVGGGGHGTAYISVTTDEDSDTQSAEADVFDQDNYPGGTLTLDTATVTASNVTFTATNGRFTCNATGIFEITVTVLIRNTASTSNGNFLIIQKGGVDAYSHEFEVDSGAGSLENSMTLSKTFDMNSGDFFNVRATFGTTGGFPQFIMLNGCTCSIKQIADDP